MKKETRREFTIQRGNPFTSDRNPLEDPTSPTNVPTEEDDVKSEDEEDETIENDDNVDDTSQSDEGYEEPEPRDEGSEEDDDDDVSADEDEEVSEDDDDEPNIYALFGQQFKKDGLLPRDAELPDDIEGLDLYAKVKQNLEESIRSRVEQEFKSQMEQKGINEDNIRRWQLLQQGYDPDQLKSANIYGQLKNYPDDADPEVMTQVIQAYHKDRGLEDYESQRILDNLEEDELQKEFKRSKQHFGQKEAQLVQAEQQAQKQLEARQQEAERRNRAVIDGILLDRKIGDTRLTPEQAKEIHDDLYQKTEKLKVQGTTYDATPFQKFDWMLKNDLTFLLDLYRSYKYKDEERQRVVSKAREEVDKNFLSAYEKSKKSKKTVKNRNSKNSSQKESPGTSWRRVSELGIR